MTGYVSTPAPFQKNKIEKVNLDVNGKSAYCLRAGSGPSVILLHGGASNCNDWVPTMEALSDSYEIYAPDMLGYGLSDRSKDSYYMSEFFDYTSDLLHTLNHSNHVLVGHSIGGRISLEMALRYPEIVRKVVLIDTVGFGKLARWGLYIGAFMYWVRKVARMNQPYPRFLVAKGEDRDWSCIERLPQLKVPTLIIWSEKDPYYPVSHALNAEQLIPDVRLEIFPGYGHAPHINSPDNFHKLLVEFIES